MSEEKVGRELNDEEKKALLHIARKSIECAVAQEPTPQFNYDFAVFREKRGAFVTLHRQGQLRGCIGYVFAYHPLIETIQETAQAAALRDPRFPPVTTKEIPELDIEISVLSPLREIHDIKDIKVGTHGIYIKRDFNSGLLLPQVATQYNWQHQEFVEQTCLKAGLSQNAWQNEDTQIYIFSAQVFGEDDFSDIKNPHK